MENLNFKHYAGDAHFAGMNVAVYEDTNTGEYVLQAENIQKGKDLSKPVRVTREQYAVLREEWEDGTRFPTDVNVTLRALETCNAYSEY